MAPFVEPGPFLYMVLALYTTIDLKNRDTKFAKFFSFITFACIDKLWNC